MTDRIIEISENPAKLHVKNEQLVIECADFSTAIVPLADIAALIVSNPRVNCTQAVLAGIVRHGGTFICCDERHMPVGMLLPLTAR